jgi:hypothetical protein
VAVHAVLSSTCGSTATVLSSTCISTATVFLLVTEAAAVICWFLGGDIFKGRAHSGFAAVGSQILGPLSPPHDRSPAPLGTSPVKNQQVSYAHVLQTCMTTCTLNTICVQVCGLLGTDAARRTPETMLVGTDVPLSMYVALFRPLAMIVLLSTLRQAHTE